MLPIRTIMNPVAMRLPLFFEKIKIAPVLVNTKIKETHMELLSKKPGSRTFWALAIKISSS